MGIISSNIAGVLYQGAVSGVQPVSAMLEITAMSRDFFDEVCERLALLPSSLALAECTSCCLRRNVRAFINESRKRWIWVRPSQPLQPAIKAASGSNTAVVLCRGEHVEQEVIQLAAGVQIHGERGAVFRGRLVAEDPGAAVLVRGLQVVGVGQSWVVAVKGRSELILDGCRIRGGMHGVVVKGEGSKVSLTNCHITESRCNGVFVAATGVAKLDECEVVRCAGVGVLVTGADSRASVSSSEILENGFSGISVGAAGSVQVQQCAIVQNGGYGVVACDAGSRVEMLESYVAGSDAFGVYMHASASGSFERCEMEENEGGNWKVHSSCSATIVP